MSRVAVSLLVLLSALPAFAAGGVVAITDGRVAQYKEALTAAQGVISDATVVDLAAGDPSAKLKELQPGVILAVGQRALQAARALAPETPVVHCMVLGAAAAGSRNVTGVRLEVSPAELLASLKSILPAARRVGVIYDPRTLGWYHDEADKAARALGLSLVAKAVTDARDVRGAADAITGQIDVLWLWPDPRLINSEMFSVLLLSTIDRHVALVGFLDSFTEKGALASVSPDYREAGKRAAKLAQELVARAPAARLPVPAPLLGPGELTVNLKAARQLGVEVPAAALAHARQVFR
jgi:putative ABC transport system substrate-binding protein